VNVNAARRRRELDATVVVGLWPVFALIGITCYRLRRYELKHKLSTVVSDLVPAFATSADRPETEVVAARHGANQVVAGGAPVMGFGSEPSSITGF